MTLYPPAALKTLGAAQFPRSAPNHSSSATFPAQRLSEAASLNGFRYDKDNEGAHYIPAGAGIAISVSVGSLIYNEG
jgi:hypothetical protein